MDEPAPKARRLWVYVACLVAAALLYPMTLLSIRDMRVEPTNVGSSALLGVSEFLLWLALIAFVYSASARAPSTPLIHVVRALVALGGALASLYAVSGPEYAIWVWTTPWLMPPLATLFGLWSTWRPGAPVKTRHLFALGFAAVALPLIAAPFVQAATYDSAAFFRRELDEIDPGSGIGEFVSYISILDAERDPGGELRRRAIARIRTVPSRQADTVRLLGEGSLRFLSDMWRFDLAATDPLCRAYAAALAAEIGADAPPNGLSLDAIRYFMPQERNISWLARGGCDLTQPVTRLAAAGLALPPEHRSEREFAARLEALLRPRAPPAP